MTCYLHIGTMKTGTSSIQNFLYLNRELLKQQNYYYPISIKNIKRLNDHNPFAHKIDGLLKYSDNLDYLCKNFSDLKQEIIDSNCDNIIISAENLQWLFDSKNKIFFLKHILEYLGFNKIYIIVYLRETMDLFVSMCSQAIKCNSHDNYHLLQPNDNYKSFLLCNHKQTLQYWSEIGDLIVRLFSNSEFYDQDLLKDFIHNIGLKWSDNFIIPYRDNESLNLIGIELLIRINKINPYMYESRYFDIVEYFNKHFSFKDIKLKFQPKKEIMQSYIDYFEESNEWVRKEFFPHKERLFPKKDLTSYKENYKLKEMKPEYLDKIAEFVVDVFSTKNKIIQDQISQIQTLEQCIQLKNQVIQENRNQMEDLQKDLQNTNNNLNKTKYLLSFQTKHGIAKARIQNQLSYKLGQTLIINLKSIFGILCMPIYIISTILTYNQEQKTYKEKIKKDPSLKLPPLEKYPDYQEALKEKECLTYKLGQALIKANKTWYKGGYIKLWFEIRKLKKEFVKN